jgi:hypothetical protein
VATEKRGKLQQNYKEVAASTFLYASSTWVTKNRNIGKIKRAKITFLRITN